MKISKINILLNVRSKIIVWSQIILQTIFPLFTVFPAHAASTQPEETATTTPYSQQLSALASGAANGSDGIKSAATTMATGAAASSVEQWLNQFGTARVQLNVDDNGNWDDSALDLLVPIYDNKKSVLFTQLGLRAPDGRTTGNVGLGVRTFYLENWMFGGNVFFDDDFTGKNRRIGFGAEAWTNNLKLSANTYIGTTDWHSSRDFDDYNEKPADGFDIRAEGYLPAYPQLGAKLMYEQYYGDKVALFDTDHLQNNPSAITTGISYTPIPLVQLALNYKRGQDSMDDTQLQANFRYDFGHVWRYQIDPDNVRIQRSLAGSRYDLVERNNQIILQYKKKEQQSVSNLNLQVTVDNSPSDGLTPDTAQVQATDKDGQPVRNAAITWTTTGTAKIAAPTSVTDDNGIATVNYTDTVAEVVNITAKSGAVVASQNSRFNTVTVSNIALKITRDNSIADGQATDQAQATVTDVNGRAIANSPVSWSVGAPGTLKNAGATTDANGQATAEFTSAMAGAVSVTVTAGDKSASGQGHFAANAATAMIDTMNVTRNNSPANGTSENQVTITVKDSSGAPVGNANVSLSADKGTVVFGAATARAKATAEKSFHTDAQGALTVGFTDTVAETVVLTASLDNGNTKTAAANFVADNKSAVLQDLKVTSDGAPANGSNANVAEVYVKDAQGNPIANMEVSWSADKSTVKFASASKTDATGKATVNFTDTVAENPVITASLSDGSTLSAQSKFIVDSASEIISTLTATSDAIADGTATNQATVTVVDSNKNPIPNADITWSIDGSAKLQAVSGKTDTKGTLTVKFTDTKAETVTIKAQLENGNNQTQRSSFTADKTAGIPTVIMTTNNSPANGTTPNVAQVTVKDENGNSVPGATVTWSVNGSAKIASASSSKTDANGLATVNIIDKTAETVQVIATLENGKSGAADSVFAVSATIALTIKSDNAAASGKDENSVVAQVTDANGTPLANQTVTWEVSGGAKLKSSSSMTNSEGMATAALTDTTAETVTVSGSTGNSTDSVTVTFRHAINLNLAVTVDNHTSGGWQNPNYDTATLTVTNERGEPVPDASVTWNIPSKGIIIDGVTQKTTQKDGSATLGLGFNDYGEATVSATVNNMSSNSVTLHAPYVAVTTQPSLDLPFSSEVVATEAPDGFSVPVKPWMDMYTSDSVQCSMVYTMGTASETDWTSPVQKVNYGENTTVVIPQEALKSLGEIHGSFGARYYIECMVIAANGQQSSHSSNWELTVYPKMR